MASPPTARNIAIEHRTARAGIGNNEPLDWGELLSMMWFLNIFKLVRFHEKADLAFGRAGVAPRLDDMDARFLAQCRGLAWPRDACIPF